MSWSMTSVSYRMSGSGSWQNLLPDEAARRLYADIYPGGTPLPAGGERLDRLFHAWQQAGIVAMKDQRAVPRGPIMTEEDLGILHPWFKDMADAMSGAVAERLDDYRTLATRLAEGIAPGTQATDNLLTILICAITLDSWVFSRLRQEVIGTYPPKGSAGNFFFWGYAFSKGPKRIFGFTTYGGWTGPRLHMIRSHGLDRKAVKAVLNRQETWNILNLLLPGRGSSDGDLLKNRFAGGTSLKTIEAMRAVGLVGTAVHPRLAIPVWSDRSGTLVSQLCSEVSLKIHHHFISSLDGLERLRRSCSFAGCTRPDSLCMIFHLAYAYAADTLVAQGTIPDFPQKAGAEWGVWIH